MKVRRLLKILHRDIGYLGVGLTVIFAVSGIAVNHIEDWNPNYVIEKKKVIIEDIPAQDEQKITDFVLEKLQINEKVQGWHKTSKENLRIFLDGQTIDVNLNSGAVNLETVTARPFLREFNFLHLNEPKKAWTWFSDLYAVSLLFLAISGMFLLKGSKGMIWRGTWMVSVGVLLPVLFLIYFS